MPGQPLPARGSPPAPHVPSDTRLDVPLRPSPSAAGDGVAGAELHTSLLACWEPQFHISRLAAVHASSVLALGSDLAGGVFDLLARAGYPRRAWFAHSRTQLHVSRGGGIILTAMYRIVVRELVFGHALGRDHITNSL